MQLAPKERYHFKAFYGSSHTWALGQCETLAKNFSVLDVGVGDGSFVMALRNKGFSELYGVEIDPRAREAAGPLYIRIEPTLDAFAAQEFDLILLLDVLEHLTEPFAFFEQVCKLLKPGGTLLVSVPNVAHWSVRFQLLLGMWHYTKRGLLDETHYHFFTRQHFKQLLASQPSLQLQSLDASISPAEFALPRWAWHNPLFAMASRVRQLGARLWPGLLAYQHMARLRKNG
ncbi:MAG: class I SAM-dependent methyltransferase [Oligoflexia bacterium]|nr:class I SAM-dependent methyltransferase [Oligoflexia bacterium]